MFFTVAWWLIGIVTLLYILVPAISLVFGLGTHHTWLPGYMFGFLFLNVTLGIGIIFVSLDRRIEGEKIRIRDAIAEYSLIVNSLFIYSKAAINALVFKRYIGFVRTSKIAEKSNLWVIKWNLLFAVILFGLSLYALYYAMISSEIINLRTYFPLSLWLLFYSLIFFSSIIFVGGKNE